MLKALGLQVGNYRYRSLIDIPYRNLIEALYTLNSPPVVSFNFSLGFRGLRV